MIVNEEMLLQSGFTRSEIEKIELNVKTFGGTLEAAIVDLARRFRVLCWIVFGCLFVFIATILTDSAENTLSAGIGIAISITVVAFIQPPVLAFKAWRYWKKHRR